VSVQAVAALISFIGIAGMIAIFVYVLSKSGAESAYPEIQSKAYRLRSGLFAVLLVGFFVLPALTLRDMPYSLASELREPTIVDVTAKQWNWTLSREQVPANTPVVFRVETEDVNHGMAIYDPDSRLIAQVQAMPGYVNSLAVEFEEPGEYRILCLEYCGLAHHVMAATLEVVSSDLAGKEVLR
jgi:cytochrome c oxidase subunit 2